MDRNLSITPLMVALKLHCVSGDELPAETVLEALRPKVEVMP